MMGILKYGNEQTGLLAQRDERLGAFIERKGFVERHVFDDFFTGLCYNIIGQQLSMKACETLWNKFIGSVGEPLAENCTDALLLKQCGLSRAKAECIAECAARYISGELDEKRLISMTDSEAIAALTAIRGIGIWTAEMVLIFCLARPDVLSLSDFGIRKGLSLLHSIAMTDKKAMERFKALYSPYGTVASVYLWEAARDLDIKEK